MSPEYFTFLLQIALEESANSVNHHNGILLKQNVIQRMLQPTVLMQHSLRLGMDLWTYESMQHDSRIKI